MPLLDLDDAALVSIAMFAAKEVVPPVHETGWRRGDLHSRCWWLDLAGPVGEAFFAMGAGRAFRLVCRRFGRVFSVECAAARAGGRRVLVPTFEDNDPDNNLEFYNYWPAPILAFEREAAARALVGRAEAVIQFQAAAGWVPQLNYPADVPPEVADRVADCVAGREFLLDVVGVSICKDMAYRPRDVAVCEKLHRYATSLLPAGAVASDLPEQLLALKDAPPDDGGWAHAEHDDPGAMYEDEGYLEDWDLRVAGNYILTDFSNDVDLRAHLRSPLDAEEREHRRQGASYGKSMLVCDEEVTRGGLRLAALPWCAREVEERRSGDRPHGPLFDLEGGFALQAGGGLPDEADCGYCGGVLEAARHLEAMAREDARLLADAAQISDRYSAFLFWRRQEPKFSEDNSTSTPTFGNRVDPAEVARQNRYIATMVDTAHARIATATAKAASLRRLTAGPVVRLLAKLRALRRARRATAPPGTAWATVTRADLPDVLFRHLAGFLADRDGAPTDGLVRLRTASFGFGYVDSDVVYAGAAAAAAAAEDEAHGRGPSRPLVMKATLSFEVVLGDDWPTSDMLDGPHPPTLTVTGWLSGFAAPSIFRDDRLVLDAADALLHHEPLARLRAAATRTQV